MQDKALDDRPQGAAASPWTDRFLPGEDEDAGGLSGTFFDLSVLRGIVFRQRFLVLGTIVAAIIIGLVATLLMKPVYSASSTVRVDPNGMANVVEGQDLQPFIAANEIARYLHTQGDVIRSRQLASRVYDSLPADAQAMLLQDVDEKSRPAGMTDDQWKQKKHEIGTAILHSGVTAQVPLDSRIITITFTSREPVLAARVANAYADNFLLEDLRNGLEANAYARKYLNKQITDMRKKVQDAELAANAYAKANGIVTQPMAGGDDKSSDGAPASVLGTTLASVNSTYADARAKRIDAEQRWRAVQNVPASQLPQVQQNTVVQSLMSNRADLTGQLSDLRQRYGEQYPKIVELKSQISALDRQIADTSSDIKKSIRIDYEVAQRQEQAMAGELKKVSGETMNEQDLRVRYSLLIRNAQAFRVQLGALLDRYNQVSTAANVNNGSVTKLDAANVPSSPVSPNLAKNLLIALVLGVSLGVGLAVLREAFDDRLRSAEDVERKLGVPMLGLTPYVSDDDLAEEASNPYSALMEAYSSLRTAIDFTLPRDHQVLQITSSAPSEGKTITSVSMAKKFASVGRKVLLIDSDLRKPSVARQFGVKRPEQGLAEVLLGHTELASVLLPDMPENLDVLPVGTIPPNPVELLSSDMMVKSLKAWREAYDVVIFDSSPVMGLADAPLIGRMVDATVFIVEANRVHFGQAKTAIRRLRSSGSVVAGVVLTKFRARDAGQNYSYEYDYYQYGETKAG